MMAIFTTVGAEPFGRLRQANLILLGLMPAALLLARGGAEIIMAVIGVSFLCSTVGQRKWDNLTEPVVAILLVTWILLNLVISPLAIEPAVSFSRSLLWLRFVMFFAATATWLLRDIRDLKVVLALWAATLALAMLDGYVQLATGTSLSGHRRDGSRLTGPLERPNIGMFVTRMGFPLLAIAMLLRERREKAGPRLFLLVFFALTAFAFVILSGDRTASVLTVLAILSGAGIVVVFIPRLSLYAALLVAVVSAILVLLFIVDKAVQDRVLSLWETLNNFWSSPYGKIFHAAFKIWQQEPITGAGLKGFQNACQTLLPPSMADACHPHAHNIYLEWLSESGLIGATGFVAFVVTAAVMVLRLTLARPDRRLTGAVLCGGLIVTLFPVAATQSFFSNWPAMVLWTALGVIVAVARIGIGTPADEPAATTG